MGRDGADFARAMARDAAPLETGWARRDSGATSASKYSDRGCPLAATDPEAMAVEDEPEVDASPAPTVVASPPSLLPARAARTLTASFTSRSMPPPDAISSSSGKTRMDRSSIA
mmetsp:Transcript_13952/g.43929  ORF Transcript_13952/g.43929 Transcript_13952/m.43929 type:complete len:114 (+) Transcript_13952:1613-1954(+)